MAKNLSQLGPGFTAVRTWRSAALALFLLLGAPALFAQQSLTVSATAPTAASRNARQSHVIFAGGLLTVQANNASLNGLVREIARTTGMKITGSVAEDRVFGIYGPADPQKLLAPLLDGTGTNLLILSNSADTPVELVLTPRTGAASPPSPAETPAEAPNDADNAELPPPVNMPRHAFGRAGVPETVGSQPSPEANSSTPPAPDPNNQPSSVSQQIVFPPIDATSAPATGTTSPVNPDDGNDPSTNAVKTPQQIFDQLQKLRQQSNDTPQP